MAKKVKKTAEIPEEKQGKKPGIFQKLLLWILIPLLFTVAIVLIIAKFTDVNVFDKAKELTADLPIIGDEEGKDKNSGKDNLILEERVVNLQAELKEKEAELFKIQTELEVSSNEKEALLLEQERLLDEIAVLQRGDENAKQKFKEIISTFEKMSAKSAAPVITNMTDAEAIQILTSLKPDTLAAILEKMTPKDAAKYTSLMTK